MDVIVLCYPASLLIGPLCYPSIIICSVDKRKPSSKEPHYNQGWNIKQESSENNIVSLGIAPWLSHILEMQNYSALLLQNVFKEGHQLRNSVVLESSYEWFANILKNRNLSKHPPVFSSQKNSLHSAYLGCNNWNNWTFYIICGFRSFPNLQL